MKKRDRKDALKTAISYICTNCGYAAISDREPDKCEKCSHSHFDVVKIRYPGDVRRTFAKDNRQVNPI